MRILNCKTYQYINYDNHIQYSEAQLENYNYCKTIKWDDYKGKLTIHVSELPYYHPYWHKLVLENQISIESDVKKQIEQLKSYKGKYADRAEGKVDELYKKLDRINNLKAELLKLI